MVRCGIACRVTTGAGLLLGIRDVVVGRDRYRCVDLVHLVDHSDNVIVDNVNVIVDLDLDLDHDFNHLVDVDHDDGPRRVRHRNAADR